MSNTTTFGADLQLTGAASAVDMKTQLAGAKQALLDLAQSADAGEISLQEFTAASKPLLASIRELERANKVLVQAERERAQALRVIETAEQQQLDSLAAQITEQMAAADASDRHAAALRRQADSARLAAEASGLATPQQIGAEIAHVEEMAAMALRHRAEMEQFASREAIQTAEATQIETGEVYELADAYEVLGAEVTTVFTSAAQVPKAFNWMDVIQPKARKLTEDFDFANVKLRGVAPAAETASRGMRNWGQSALIASQGLEDVQYGVGGLLNNIPYLVMSMGGPMGVAAATSVVAVGAFQLYKHWDSLANIFADKQPFPKAANDLRGLNEQLDKTKDELKELEKLGSLTIGQADRVGTLRKNERELDEQIKLKQELDRIGHLKTNQEESVIKAFQEAVQAGGGGKIIDDLKEAAALNEKDINPILEGLAKGQIAAYDKLVKALELGLGPGSDLEKELKNRRPMELPKVNAFEEAAREAKDRNREEARKVGTDMAEKGAEVEAEFMKELADETRTKVTESAGTKLKETLIRLRSAGLTGAKELTYLKVALGDEISRLFPELEKFPALATALAGELARKIKKEVDDAVAQLQQLEGLTKREALRRLNQQGLEKKQGQVENLAADEFTQFAQRQAARQARLNPGMPGLAPAQAAEQGRQLQDQLKELGVGPQEMVRIGKLLNNPAAQRKMPAAMEALGNAGFGEAEAVRALPDFMGQLFQGGNFNAAVNRIVNQRMAAERKAMNERLKPRNRDAAGFQSIAPAPPGPQADALPAVQTTQQAMAQTQQAVAKQQTRIAKIETDAQALLRQASRLMARATENQPSALNSGSSVA